MTIGTYTIYEYANIIEISLMRITINNYLFNFQLFLLFDT